MPIVLDADCKDNILCVNVSGNFSLWEAKTTFCNILDMLKIYSLKKVLIDCRSLNDIPYSISEVFDYSEYTSNELFHRINHDNLLYPKFAYLFYQDDFEKLDSVETLGVNRGVWVKIFKETDQAMEWLQN